METDLLATFLAIVDEGSVAGAARRLGVSAGAVRFRMKAAEAMLGAPLVRRAGRGVAVSAEGGRLVEAARAIVAKVADLQALARAGVADGKGEQGEIRLGAIATAITGLLPSVLARATEQHPRLNIFIEPGTSLDLYAQVNAGALDCALIVQPPGLLRKNEAFAPWQFQPLVLIAPYGWSGRDAGLLLSSAPFIRYDRRNWGGRLVDLYLKQIGISPNDRYELDALDGIVALVSAGLGVAIVPDWIGPRPEGMSVSVLQLPGEPMSRTIGLYHRLGTPRANLIDVLLAMFDQVRTVPA